MKQDLSEKSRYELKSLVTNYFLDQYVNNTTNTGNIHNNHNNNNNNNNYHHNNPNINNHNNRRRVNARRAANNRRIANNNYGQLQDGPRPVFQSRWDDGPVNLI